MNSQTVFRSNKGMYICLPVCGYLTWQWSWALWKYSSKEQNTTLEEVYVNLFKSCILTEKMDTWKCFKISLKGSEKDKSTNL